MSKKRPFLPSEVDRLLKAVENYKQNKQGFISWEVIKVEAKLSDDFTTRQVSEKYRNLQKLQKRKSENSERPEEGNDNEEVENVDEIRDVQEASPTATSSNMSEKVQELLEAAQLVHPETATSNRFMKLMGYSDKPTGQQESFATFQRRMEKVTPLMPGDWRKKMLESTSVLAIDDERRVSRDLQKVKQYLQKKRTTTASELSQNLAPSGSTPKSTPAGSSKETKEAAGPSKQFFASPRQMQKTEELAKKPVVSAVSPEVAEPTSAPPATLQKKSASAPSFDGAGLDEATIAEMLISDDEDGPSKPKKSLVTPSPEVTGFSPTKQSTNKLEFTKTLPGSTIYSEYHRDPKTNQTFMPIPTGFNAMHTQRHLFDNEWRDVINYNKIFMDFQPDLTQDEVWDLIVERSRVETSKSGKEVKFDFFKYAVPRLAAIQQEGVYDPIKLSMTDCDQYACISIYHSVDKVTLQNIENVIEKMINEDILSNDNYNAHQWRVLFVKAVIENNDAYFCAEKKQFDLFKTSVLDAVLKLVT